MADLKRKLPMKSVRIEPKGGQTFAVDIVCVCGKNCLKNVLTGERSFRHPATIGESRPRSTIFLMCDCGLTYSIVAQGSHFHVNSCARGENHEVRVRTMTEAEVRAELKERFGAVPLDHALAAVVLGGAEIMPIEEARETLAILAKSQDELPALIDMLRNNQSERTSEPS